jgi:hypothetical protein
MTADHTKPLVLASLSNIRERYGAETFNESARILREYVPYFDPNHDSYYYVYHYLELIASILAADQVMTIESHGDAICDSCGGLGITSRESFEIACPHCRGEGSIIKLEINRD